MPEPRPPNLTTCNNICKTINYNVKLIFVHKGHRTTSRIVNCSADAKLQSLCWGTQVEGATQLANRAVASLIFSQDQFQELNTLVIL